MHKLPDRKVPLLDGNTGNINWHWYDFFLGITTSNGGTSGSLNLGARSVSANTNAGTSDFSIFVTTGAGTISVGLPTATGSGRVLAVKKVDSGAGSVSIVPLGSDTIEGGGTLTFSGHNMTYIIQDGVVSKWYILSDLLLLTG